MNNKEKLLIVLAIVIVGLLIAILDKVEPVVSDYHCEMVALWKEGEKHGVEPADRAGWPDYNNTCEVSK